MNDPGPEIEYPCRWSYKVVGRSESELRAAIALAVGDLEHTIAFSRTSSAGRYVSLRVEVLVRDQDERHGVMRVLHEHADVKFVL